jgi:hypothetical protein
VAIARGAVVHPGPPRDPLVAELSRDRRIAASSARTSPV